MECVRIVIVHKSHKQFPQRHIEQHKLKAAETASRTHDEELKHWLYDVNGE